MALRRQGMSVRFVGSLFVPGDETVFFEYAADSSEEVVHASREVELPFSRITLSVWLRSEDEPSLEEASCDPL